MKRTKESIVCTDLEQRLQENGWQTGRNYTYPTQGDAKGELDLYAFKGRYLLIFEHKSTPQGFPKARVQLSRAYEYFGGRKDDGRKICLFIVNGSRIPYHIQRFFPYTETKSEGEK